MSENNQPRKASRLKMGLFSLAALGLASIGFSSISGEDGLSGQAIGEQATPSADTNGAWELVAEDDGFVTKRMAVEGSPIMAFRGETVVDVPLSKILTVFLDSERRKDWVDRFDATQDVEVVSDLDRVYWIRFELPFPLSDRDYLLRATGDMDPDNRVFVANIRSVNHPNRGEDDCCVRAEAFRTYYRFQALPGENKTKIEVEVHTDPKGMLPGWLVNMVQEDWPQKTLLSLAREAGKDEIPSHKKFVGWESK